jgi:NAD(P)-dependent dehydrogenase (short-subunit alcohol dehydrogenase family)
MNDFFEGKVCAVTGGAQGLGWAITQALADRGAQVFACDLSPENLAAAGESLGDLPFSGRVHLARCDVADRAAVDDWIGAVQRQAGRVDVLVNNAAFVRWRDVTELALEDELRTMRVCFEGMLHGARAVLPGMRAARSGVIVNIGSSMAKLLIGHASACYAAAKAAIDAYTQLLALELAGSGVRTVLVRPGAIAGTSFFRENVAHTRLPRFADLLPAVTPPRMAAVVLAAIERGRPVVNFPRYLPLTYLMASVAPRFMRWLMRGQARRDPGQLQWRYVPRARPLSAVSGVSGDGSAR